MQVEIVLWRSLSASWRPGPSGTCPASHFRVAAAVCVMIEDCLLPAKQRATALFIIHDLYKADPPGVHPFMPFLVAMLQQPTIDLALHERNLLCQLLSALLHTDVAS